MEGKAPQFIPPTRTTRDRYAPVLSDRLYRLVTGFVLVPLVWGFAAVGVLVVAMLLYGLARPASLKSLSRARPVSDSPSSRLPLHCSSPH